MRSISAFVILLLASLSSAQNPYALKRPSYCSTCFTNDQRQNYYCCFYFFRCCAESRLGSNNRRVTTPNPEYPGYHTTHETVDTTEQVPLDIPCETESVKHTPESQNNQEFRKPSDSNPCNDDDDDESGLFSRTNKQDESSSSSVSKSSEKASPNNVGGTRPRDADRSPGTGSIQTTATSYSSAYGGRRYPYNVQRVYPAQQPSRNTGRRTPGVREGGGFSGTVILNARYGERSESVKDSKVDIGQQRRRTDGVENADDVFWGRMDPV